MKEPSIQEKNETIAKWVGVEVRKYDNLLIIPNDDGFVDWTEEIQHYSPDLNWNQLMNVVEQCKLKQRGKWSDRTRVLYVDIEIALCEVDIHKVHEAVYQFILWHQKQKA